MIAEQVKEAIKATPKGSNIIVEWTRNGKTRKRLNITDEITKSVRMVGRIGIEYDNTKSVQVKRATGELPTENQGLPWGEFEIYPYLIKHKTQQYLRFFKGTGNSKPQVQWFKNGIAVSLESIKDLMPISESKTGKPTPDCFCIKIDSITRLNSEVEAVVEQEKVEVAVGVGELV